MKPDIFSFLLAFCLLSQRAAANDGAFYAEGNTLIPLKETTIRMKKEVLNLTRNGGIMQVDIYFEFYNPGEEKQLLVGFVTPPAGGDVEEGGYDHPQIDGFMVMVGNEILPYKIVRMEGSGFRLPDSIAGGDDFVYYFTVHFRKGLTVIRHSYQYLGGNGVEFYEDYGYRLTTGTTWAGGAIEDFELNIRMGDELVFEAPYQFTSQPADWKIIGIGRAERRRNTVVWGVDDHRISYHNLVYIRSGFLQLRATNFRPVTDIRLNVPQLHNEVPQWCREDRKHDFMDLITLYNWQDSAAAVIGRLSDQELQLYRNLNYARNGYVFRDENLRNTFSNYIWYIPDPSVRVENTRGRYISQKNMDLILAEEKKRKLPGKTQTP